MHLGRTAPSILDRLMQYLARWREEVSVFALATINFS